LPCGTEEEKEKENIKNKRKMCLVKESEPKEVMESFPHF